MGEVRDGLEKTVRWLWWYKQPAHDVHVNWDITRTSNYIILGVLVVKLMQTHAMKTRKITL